MPVNRLRCLAALATALAAAVSLPAAARAAEEEAVRLQEETIHVPTYRLGPAEKNPIFYQGRKYQGAQGLVYPYPLLDRLTDEREDAAWQAVILENAFVRFTILPELGGRIFTGTDKTNQYEFFYRQHVIKPALIGMAGAWISGGVEWNIPHHHRVSTSMPVDYRLMENPDGSKTLWLGELELRHRTRWLVGLTLHPDKSYLKITVKLINRTPLPLSMLYFANVAVHANADYQVLFPPGTQFGTQHAKREFVHWPLGQETYAGIDYTGVDVSWWKNHPKPVSIFACNDEEDFFGGYDHGRRAGVVQVADHHVAPGKKFFEWGNGPEGRMWDKVLTESDGPYLELMAGAWSDNQPDYSWVQPYEIRVVDQYWYPIRELAGLKQANLDGALNLDVREGRVRLAVNSTSARRGAKASLRSKNQALLEQTIDIAPAKPFVAEVDLPAGVREEDLVATLTDADGRELIRYQPVRRAEKPLPEPVQPPKPPAEIKTNEELFLIGQRLEQFHNPALSADLYYQEALRRDPDDARVNTALGVRCLKQGRFADAERHLRTALERLTWNYTRPKDGEAHYYLGVTLRYLGREAEAADCLHRATWSQAWKSAAYHQLAELACRRNAWDEALHLLYRPQQNEVLSSEPLLVAIVRHRGFCDMTLRVDPLDFWAGWEDVLVQAASPHYDAGPRRAEMTKLMRGNVQSYLEVAANYAAAGMWDDAIEVLEAFLAGAPGKQRVDPMVHYDLGYYWTQRGDLAKAAEHYRTAKSLPPDYCFPFRLESIAVLGDAMRVDPTDARAPYYLGNLLYDLQPDEAIAAWERSRELDPKFATVHRNLGLAYAQRQRDPAKAAASYEKALACDPNDPRVYAEWDPVCRQAGIDPAKRLAALEAHHDVVAQRMDSALREILLNVLVGRYDRALELLGQEHFRRWEGEMGAHDVYVEAHVLRGLERLAAGHAAEALEDFDAARQYPDNLEVGQPYLGGDRDAKIEYSAGLAHEKLGQAEKAKTCFQAAAKSPSLWSEDRYYQALACRKLGQDKEADQRFAGLVTSGREVLNGPAPIDFFAKFGVQPTEAARHADGHFQIALGLLGQNQPAEARRELQQAARLDVDHLGVRTHLQALQTSGTEGGPAQHR